MANSKKRKTVRTKQVERTTKTRKRTVDEVKSQISRALSTIHNPWRHLHSQEEFTGELQVHDELARKVYTFPLMVGWDGSVELIPDSRFGRLLVIHLRV